MSSTVRKKERKKKRVILKNSCFAKSQDRQQIRTNKNADQKKSTRTKTRVLVNDGGSSRGRRHGGKKKVTFIKKNWQFYRRRGAIWSDPYHIPESRKKISGYRPELDEKFREFEKKCFEEEKRVKERERMNKSFNILKTRKSLTLRRKLNAAREFGEKDLVTKCENSIAKKLERKGIVLKDESWWLSRKNRKEPMMSLSRIHPDRLHWVLSDKMLLADFECVLNNLAPAMPNRVAKSGNTCQSQPPALSDLSDLRGLSTLHSGLLRKVERHISTGRKIRYVNSSLFLKMKRALEVSSGSTNGSGTYRIPKHEVVSNGNQSDSDDGSRSIDVLNSRRAEFSDSSSLIDEFEASARLLVRDRKPQLFPGINLDP